MIMDEWKYQFRHVIAPLYICHIEFLHWFFFVCVCAGQNERREKDEIAAHSTHTNNWNEKDENERCRLLQKNTFHPSFFLFANQAVIKMLFFKVALQHTKMPRYFQHFSYWVSYYSCCERQKELSFRVCCARTLLLIHSMWLASLFFKVIPSEKSKTHVENWDVKRGKSFLEFHWKIMQWSFSFVHQSLNCRCCCVSLCVNRTKVSSQFSFFSFSLSSFFFSSLVFPFHILFNVSFFLCSFRSIDECDVIAYDSISLQFRSITESLVLFILTRFASSLQNKWNIQLLETVDMRPKIQWCDANKSENELIRWSVRGRKWIEKICVVHRRDTFNNFSFWQHNRHAKMSTVRFFLVGANHSPRLPTYFDTHFHSFCIHSVLIRWTHSVFPLHDNRNQFNAFDSLSESA